jgi:hypothetical protein
MTKAICSYCKQSHGTTRDHETVCDNVKQNYPLYLSESSNEPHYLELANNYFLDEIKALKNDYIILNTLRQEALEQVAAMKKDLESATRELKLAKSENYRLKNPNYKENI